MTRKKNEAAQAAPRPRRGGSYLRDLRTGRLERIAEPDSAPEGADEPAADFPAEHVKEG